MIKQKSKSGRGWKVLINSPKAHYFVEGRSLCGKWLCLGKEDFEDSNHDHPDNCVKCKKTRKKLAELEKFK